MIGIFLWSTSFEWPFNYPEVFSFIVVDHKSFQTNGSKVHLREVMACSVISVIDVHVMNGKIVSQFMYHEIELLFLNPLMG